MATILGGRSVFLSLWIKSLSLISSGLTNESEWKLPLSDRYNKLKNTRRKENANLILIIEDNANLPGLGGLDCITKIIGR